MHVSYHFLFWLSIAICCDRVQILIAARNYGSIWNGIGAIDSVLARRAAAPMAYRVLIPWLVWLAEKAYPPVREWRMIALYEPLKIILMAISFAACEMAIGMTGALIIVAMLQTTYWYDYWDWAPEMTGLALALTGNPLLALGGGMLAALSRPETALLVPVVFVLQTGNIGASLVVALVAGATLLIVRLWAGDRKLYCSRWMLRQNWLDLKAALKFRPVYMSEMAMSVAVTALAIGAVAVGPLGWTGLVPLVLLASGWTMARARETRVFTGCLIWIAAAIVGGRP